MAPLLDLSAEIMIEVFSQLFFTDIFSCKRTCRAFLHVISDSTQLNYQIELQRAGMQDNPDCPLSVPVRLKMIKEKELAWASFDFKFITEVRIPLKSSGLNDATAGVFLTGKEHPDEELMADGIQSVRLPSRIGGNIATEWKYFNLGTIILDFRPAIEEHDLLACVVLVPDEENPLFAKVTVVLRHYSDTNKNHDAASMPFIFVCKVHAQDRPAVNIEISGENLAIIVSDLSESEDVYCLSIFNWKTGDIKTQRPLRVFNLGIAFLREDVLLQPNLIAEALDIYYIPQFFTHCASKEVQYLFSLCLPSLNPGYTISSLSIRCEPGPTSNSHFPKYLPKTHPYGNDPKVAIMLLLLEIDNKGENEDEDEGADTDDDDDKTSYFAMVVHRQALLDQVKLQEQGQCREEPRTSWELWGPPITRWFEVDSVSAWVSTNIDTFGQRYIQHINQAFHIFDFNPFHVKFMAKHGHSLLAKRDIELRVVQEDNMAAVPIGQLPESRCPGTGIFKHNLAGKLPYVQVISDQWPQPYDDFLIDEERLMAVRIEKGTDTYKIESMDVIYFG